MYNLLCQLASLREKSEAVNILVPLMLAKYHLVLILVGSAGLAAGILTFRNFEKSGRKEGMRLSEISSLVFFIVLQAGAIGWFLTPLYNFIKTAGIL